MTELQKKLVIQSEQALSDLSRAQALGEMRRFGYLLDIYAKSFKELLESFSK